MKSNGLEILNSEENGYVMLTKCNGWRIGTVNYCSEIGGTPKKRERHLNTDEAFILSCGKAWLYIGEEMHKIQLFPGRVYNVKKNVWHSVIMEEDSKIFVIEDADTGDENTERIYFGGEKL